MEKAKRKTVILIEDDQSLVEMYKDKLKNEGFRVLTVTDGRIAMQRAREGADIILLDILLPNINGFEILKKLKDDVSTKNIPVLVLTNVGSESVDRDTRLAISLGAKGYMVKSLNTPEGVVNKIREII